MAHRWILTSAIAIAAALAAACAQNTATATGPVHKQRPIVADEKMAAAVDAVLDDAAGHTGPEASSLSVEHTAAVTWPDGSLGCPEPGVVYTMSPVPGYLIVLRAGGQLMEYHASTLGQFVLCPAARALRPIEVPSM